METIRSPRCARCPRRAVRLVEYETRSGLECHCIYEQSEAAAEGISWHTRPFKGVRKGHWLLTDDGYVVQVLRTGKASDGRRWVRTCTGTYSLHARKGHLTTEERESRYSFNGKHRRQSNTVAAGAEAFAELVVRGWPLDKAYSAVYPKATNKAYVRQRATALLARPEVKRIMDQKIGDLLDSLGVDDEFVLRGFKEMAEAADKDAVRLNALQTLAKIRGIIQTSNKDDRAALPFVGVDLSALAAHASAPTWTPVHPALSDDADYPEEGVDGQLEG